MQVDKKIVQILLYPTILSKQTKMCSCFLSFFLCLQVFSKCLFFKWGNLLVYLSLALLAYLYAFCTIYMCIMYMNIVMLYIIRNMYLTSVNCTIYVCLQYIVICLIIYVHSQSVCIPQLNYSRRGLGMHTGKEKRMGRRRIKMMMRLRQCAGTVRDSSLDS